MLSRVYSIDTEGWLRSGGIRKYRIRVLEFNFNVRSSKSLSTIRSYYSVSAVIQGHSIDPCGTVEDSVKFQERSRCITGDAQFNLDNDQYPKTLAAAHKVLTEHKWDEAHRTKQKNKSKSNSKTGNSGADNQSTKPANNNSQAGNDFPTELSFVQNVKFCFICGAGARGDKYHHSNDCNNDPYVV